MCKSAEFLFGVLVLCAFAGGLHAATPSISWPGSITVDSLQLVLQGQDTGPQRGFEKLHSSATECAAPAATKSVFAEQKNFNSYDAMDSKFKCELPRFAIDPSAC